TTYTQQSYKVSDVFPFKWINKKWKEGFSVTSMTAAGNRWGIVMSRDAGYSNQVVELDFLYPSEGIHRRWENGYRITSTAATGDQAAFILSTSKRRLQDVTQETLRTSAFPSTHVKVRLLLRIAYNFHNYKSYDNVDELFYLIPGSNSCFIFSGRINGQRICILHQSAMGEQFLEVWDLRE
ncbi:unnamed protein product, partial [Ilex paraguariensis]